MKNKHLFTTPLKIFTLFLFLVVLFLSSVLSVLFIKHSTPQHLLAKLGIIEESETNYALLSWNWSLDQLDYDADAVFIGDSLTIGEDFQSYFPDKKILNLGLSGDSIDGIYDRCSVISNFTPEKIFIEGGVNSMSYKSVDYISARYLDIISLLKSENPNAEIYIQGVLPISSVKESNGLTNKNISLLNDKLSKIATEYDVIYIDINSVYSLNSEMNPLYTKDGIHLKDEAKYIWIQEIEKYIL